MGASFQDLNTLRLSRRRLVVPVVRKKNKIIKESKMNPAEENISNKLIKQDKRRERMGNEKALSQDTYFLNQGMYSYYLREKRDRNIFGGACLKKVDGTWYRGISLCSNKDHFDKNAAKWKAISRLT